ncbi:methylated-DNA--[protein]-cysteine S-methyltransferase [Paenisporosarcina cavernae]|uniref:Methylated-DNA--protein-cysteine methyltransferase n=1 Tax=Paenisporosarcina cavernae TaxID=2320858 RepID=A0A385YPC7_9BACL|nr:methylated-DNA--[protein]-cysteine S-methyltransferase [Paenisporosarcina cavernae]AYC28555.1 methylated-DNA--[protein]-cysteine S-methyltransferase [Paenisporosarcina cavernae]
METIFWTSAKPTEDTYILAATEKGLCFIGSPNEGFHELETWAQKKIPKATFEQNPPKLQVATTALDQYFFGNERHADVTLDLRGTDFQQSVWNALQKIPYGKTVSYGEIAAEIGKPSAVRAVGGAIGANPVMVFIPCHRVIGRNGTLTGFRGGLKLKEELLTLERR